MASPRSPRGGTSPRRAGVQPNRQGGGSVPGSAEDISKTSSRDSRARIAAPHPSFCDTRCIPSFESLLAYRYPPRLNKASFSLVLPQEIPQLRFHFTACSHFPRSAHPARTCRVVRCASSALVIGRPLKRRFSMVTPRTSCWASKPCKARGHYRLPRHRDIFEDHIPDRAALRIVR